MRTVYETIGLFEKIEDSCTCRLREVVSIFENQWDQDKGIEILSDLDKKRYKYSIEANRVRVKEQKKFEDSETRKTFLVGKLEEKGNGTAIEFKIYIKPFEFLSSTITSIIMLVFIIYGITIFDGNTQLFLIGLLILSPIGFGRTVYEWNSALKKMKYEFERELKFILGSKAP